MKNYQKRVTTGVYLIKDDKILFLVRNKKNDKIHSHSPGVYLPIGGHIEFRESIEEAAKREVLEESGITVHKVDLAGIINVRGQQPEHDMIVYIFTSKDFTGDPVAGNEGDFVWVDKEKLADIPTYAGDKMFHQYMLKNKFFVLDLLFEGSKMLDYQVLALLDRK